MFRLPGQRFSGSGIVEVPGHKVDVQVRHGISEQLVVHVARREDPFDHPRDGVNVAPVSGDFRGGQAREVRDVPVSKDDDRVTTSDGMALKVCVARGSHIKRITELVPTKPAIHSSLPGVPVLGPCSSHVVVQRPRPSLSRADIVTSASTMDRTQRNRR